MKAYGIPCSVCGSTIQVFRAFKSEPWKCVSSVRCKKRMKDVACTNCGHKKGRHYDPLPSLTGSACAECSCPVFSAKKVPSAAGSEAAKKAWVTIRSKKSQLELKRLEDEGRYVPRNIHLLHEGDI